MRGRIVLKYAIFSTNEESRCNINAIPYTYEISHRNQNLEPITIEDLQYSCNYTVRVTASRSKDESYKSIRAYPEIPIAIEASTVIAGKIEDLSVTSQGPDQISLRWLPPRTSTGPLEYRVYVGLDKKYKSILTPKNCLLWPQYHCDDEIIKSPVEDASYTYRFRIFAIKKNGKKGSIQNEIDEATKFGIYEEVMTESWEREPDPPYNVSFNWTNGLNVFWNHPNATRGLVKYFTISIELQCDNIGSETITEIYNVENRKKYLFQYLRNIDIKKWCRETSSKLEQIEVCIKTNLQKHESKCAKTDTIFPPPPIEYNGDIRFVNGGLKIPMLKQDCFLSFYNVYKASVFQQNEAQAELLKIMEHLKNNTSFSPSIYEIIYAGNRYNGDYTITRNLLNLTIDVKYIIITLVVVNELNGLRTLNYKSVEVLIPKINNEASHLSALFILLVFLPVFCYFAYRYRRQIMFKTGRLREDVAVYFANGETECTLLRGDSTIHESQKNSYDRSLGDQLFLNYSKIINVENLRDYIKSAIGSQELLRQHEMISRINNIPKSDCGSLPQNKDKNRYDNIVAYDHTRVRLSNSSRDSDYINANYIDGYQYPKAYIAAQGPKPNTINDFWIMIWENRVGYIVMLCNLYDGNKKNCEQYWPDKDTMEFNGLTVEFINNKNLPTFDERQFRICLNGKARMVTHIQFKSWPPVGQALFPQTLMPLLQKLLALPNKANSPILVHCSAGVGRTGTIILCDICLRMAAAKSKVDILAILARLRNQRPNMVNNIEQYKLAHLAILTSLTASGFLIKHNGDFEAKLNNTLKQNELQTQMAYIRDSEWQDDAMKTVTAVQRHVPIIAEKNRFPDILADKVSQVFLQQLPNQDSSSCYINALHVNSLYKPNRYIVTQQPLPATLADFWRLVFEQQCTVIINLNPVNENAKASVPFWPKQGILAVDQNLHIQLVQSRNQREISLHSLRAIYKPNEFEQSRLKVQILNFNHWPSDNLIPENLEDFVSFVVEFFSIVDNDIEPLIVTCHDGATASGFFIALATLIEQIKTEKCFDLCQIIRTIRVCRKQFVNNGIQLKMLYHAAKIYLNQFGLYDEPVHLIEAQ
ncbi:unnamed protein product [Ceutorhynchus assimilis]|uniref:protein-tyrosine-phosphatase n=1 Tax=Ceutorhynchus assimilis TaxID=467358 RepID=A0A9P0GRS5_9CUCU|nr:unnamed protein product [Ceutorhynchus assimilis]